MPKLSHYQVLMLVAATMLVAMFALDYCLNLMGMTRQLDEIESLPEVKNDGT